MTKDEIKKALECCAKSYGDDVHCSDCPYDTLTPCACYERFCQDVLCKDALKIITEQENEIAKLKAENDTNAQYIRMMGIQSHIKTSNERVKQAQIDILNKLKEKYGFYSCYSWHCDTKSLSEIIDELIKEVENAEDKSCNGHRACE